MREPGFWSLIATAALLCAACVPDGRLDLEPLLEQSNFVFRGTVVQSAATTTPEVPTSENNAIVELEEVFVGGDILDRRADRRVTVLRKDPRRPAEGETVLFFAAGWIYGEGIAVREVDHAVDSRDASELRQQLAAARQALADRKLEARIQSAELVISGRVLEVSDAEIAEPVSEHAPGWVEARIEIEQVLKGEAKSEAAVFLFPSSPDVMWKDAPKFAPEQQGIWLLHRDPRLDALTLSAPIDFQALDSADRIKALGERSRSGS